MADNISVAAHTLSERVLNVPIANPGTIGNKGTFISDPITMYGRNHIAIYAQADQTATLSLQRYADLGATLAVGSPVTASMTKATMTSIDNIGTVICQAAKVSIVNSVTDVANVTSLTVLLASD